MAEMGPRWGGRAKHPCMSWDMHPAGSCPLLTPLRAGISCLRNFGLTFRTQQQAEP